MSSIIFGILLLLAIYFFSKRARSIQRNILLGRPYAIKTTTAERWRHVMLLGLGQKKMFKNKPVAFLHFVIYAGFIIINVEILEIIIDGLAGTHRIFLPLLGAAYPFFINTFELLAAGVLCVCIVFLIRRNVLSIQRFKSVELKGQPRNDANIILLFEIVLMSLFLQMNAADTLLQLRHVAPYAAHPTGLFWVSKHIHPFLNVSTPTLVVFERSFWWAHIVGILVFLNYLPFSKHLHIVLAFINAYWAPSSSQGKLENMPSVQQEVQLMMDPTATVSTPAVIPNVFGAKDVHDLTWKNLLDAYSCTECGRCTAACPANLTGKLLSPRKIMMNTRDRLEDLARPNNPTEKEEKTLLHHYITPEEIYACTTCNACVEQCPVSINPLDIIIQLRRYLIMEQAAAPEQWNNLFNNIENNFAPWKFAPTDRANWTTT